MRNHKIDLAARKFWCGSNDPNFTAKAADVVGLYIARRLLCVDEKPSIQALERAQGYLKLSNGRALTGQSHELRWQSSPLGRNDDRVLSTVRIWVGVIRRRESE
jgi:hypothetical protein